MAAVTIQRVPGNPAVMALAAVLTVDNGRHRYIAGAPLHREYAFMTCLAFELDSVGPVRENDRSQADLGHRIAISIQHDVAVF